MKKIVDNTFYFSLLVLLGSSCRSQTLPSSSFTFDTKFYNLYTAISYKDSIYFENSNIGIDTFVLTKIDSVVTDRIDCFMCPRPAKSIFRNYKQIPINYWSETRTENEGKVEEKIITREVPLITITIFPNDSINTAYISFKNFRCKIEKSLGNPMTDTLSMNGSYFTNYYILNSTAKSLVKRNEDVQTIFVTLKDGIIGYKEKSGILRKRIFL